MLKEVGKERYECALKDAGLYSSRPITLQGFYFEYEMDTEGIHLNLFYRYPSRVVFFDNASFRILECSLRGMGNGEEGVIENLIHCYCYR